MARPRGFSVDVALESAMQLFWTGGYHATSTREIEKQLDLGRQSIYNAFGDKESLYHASLYRYSETVLTDRLSMLRQPEAGRREIVQYLAGLVEFLDNDPDRRGCFLVNATTECAGSDAVVFKIARGQASETVGLLTRAIKAGIRQDHIPTGTNAETMSKLLLAAATGMCVAARTRAERKELVDIASASLQSLY